MGTATEQDATPPVTLRERGLGSVPPALRLLPERYAVCRLDPDASFDPTLLEGEGLAVLARAPGELSLVCREDARPSVNAELGFRALGVVGPLDFSLVGVLAGLTGVLAAAEVPLFAISTYDTDYLLVRDADLACALEALGAAGYDVHD